MSDWSWMRVDNRCNSLQNNAIHDRSGFRQQLLSLYSTGKHREAVNGFDLQFISTDCSPIHRAHTYFIYLAVDIEFHNQTKPRAHQSFFCFFCFYFNAILSQVYVGQLSLHYEALSVEASKQTTAEEIVACIVERLSLTVNIWSKQ